MNGSSTRLKTQMLPSRFAYSSSTTTYNTKKHSSVLKLLAAYRNELLRAIDLRLNALREELNTAFDQAAGSRYSVEELTDLEKFANHFGSRDLR